MAVHRIRRGLDLPISGAPAPRITDGPEITRVAFVGDDLPGLRARVRVRVGQTVRRGQLLCEDAATPGVRHTSPGAGRVEAIHRGPRRALQSIVVSLSEGERSGTPTADEVEAVPMAAGSDGEGLSSGEVRAPLVASGLWTAFRTRPFSKVPAPETTPAAIFVTAIDTNPLAAEPAVVLAGAEADFERGLRAVAKLTQGVTYLCVRAGSPLARGVDAPVRVEEFAGPHPAGSAGVHIHLLEPVGRRRTVWSIGYQDVTAIGGLVRTGRPDVGRTIALAGPPVRDPRLVRTRLGASVAELTAPEALGPGVRWISGSVLSGKAACGEAFGYLGRYDVQLCALREAGDRELLAWLAPGRGKHSVLPVFAPRLRGGDRFDFSTDAHGSRRAIIPIGAYERVMPMDILPTFLLRALAVNDFERAEELGCLELAEEDLALCSYVDAGKSDFGPMLRRNLELIQRAG